MTDAIAPAAPPPGPAQPSLDDHFQRRVVADNAAGALERLTAKYGAKPPEATPGAAPAPTSAAVPAGPSSALAHLAEKYGTSAAGPAPAPGREPVSSTAGGVVRATATDVLKGLLVEAPRAVWRGVNDAVNSFGDALTEPFGIDLYKMDEASAKALGVDPSWFQSKIAAPETYTGAGIEHVSQFVAGMVPVAKALQSVGLAATVGRPLAAAAAGAIGNMLSSPSHGGNLSNLIQEVPALRNPVTEWLASDPNDGVALGKLKQGLEGAGIGMAIDATIGALKVYRQARDLGGVLPEAAVAKAEAGAPQAAEAAAPAVTERDWIKLGGKPEAPLFATATETAQASAAKLIQANTPDEMSAMLDQLRAPTTIQKPQGLLSWLQGQGGVVDAGGELRALDLRRTRPGLINKSGMSLDDAAQAAQAEGFIGQAAGAGVRDVERASINDLLDAIDRETHGSPVYRQDDPTPDKFNQLNELQGRLNQLGLDPKTATNEEIGRALEEHARGPAAPEVPPSLAAGRQVAGAEAEGLDLHEQPAQTLEDISRETGDPGYAAAAGEGPGRIRLGSDKIGNINLNRISGEGDIREVVRQLAGELDQATGKLTTTRRGWDAEQASADRLLQDNFIVRRLATGQGSGTAFTASEARATQLIINNLGANAKALAAKIAAGQGTDLDKAALVQLGTHMEGWLAVRSGAMREAGRALAIGRMMGDTSKGAETAIRGLMAQGATAERMAAVLNALDKPGQIETFFRGPWYKRVGDAAFDAFRGSVLSSPWAQARNNLGNSLNLMSAIGERSVAAGISQTVGSGEVLHGEAPAMAWGMVANMNDALRAAGAAFRQGLGDMSAAKPEARAPAISAYRLGLNEQSWYGKATDFYGQWVNGYVFRAMAAGDEFASTLARGAQRYALAYREAWKDSVGIEQAAAKMKLLLDAPPAELEAQAEQFARNLTLRDPMGDIGLGFAKLRQDTPFARFVLPFLQTPANAFKYRLARSPLALATPAFWNDQAAGGARKDLAIAKFGLGSLIGSTVAGWVAQGYATGAGPQDPATRGAWEREGKLPYAVKIGDRWVQYSQVDPVGLSLGVMADVAHMLDVADDVKGLASDPKRLDQAYQRLIRAGMKPAEANAATQRAEEQMSQGLNNLPGMLIQSLMYNVVNQSSLSGFSQIAEGIFGDTGKTTGEKLTSTLRDTFLATVVPQSGLLRWAERITDPELRESKGVVEALKAMIPGMSEGLPVMPNLWGEPRVSAVARSPYATRTTADAHPIDREMDRLGHAASMPDKAVMGVGLTADQYTEYVGLAGNGLKAVAGMGARELLDAMVSGDTRNPLVAGYVRQYHDPRLATDGPDGTRAAMIDKVISGYRQAAQVEMMKRHPDLRVIAEAQKLAGADARTGVGRPAVPLLNQ